MAQIAATIFFAVILLTALAMLATPLWRERARILAALRGEIRLAEAGPVRRRPVPRPRTPLRIRRIAPLPLRAAA